MLLNTISPVPITFRNPVAETRPFKMRGAPIQYGSLSDLVRAATDAFRETGQVIEILADASNMFYYRYPSSVLSAPQPPAPVAATTHLHPVPEHVWVIEGSYFDPELDSCRYMPGTFVRYPAHSIHTPTSDDGAVLLCHSRMPKFNARRADQPKESNPFLDHIRQHRTEVQAVTGITAEELLTHFEPLEVVAPAKPGPVLA